jgi:hypothetical protein
VAPRERGESAEDALEVFQVKPGSPTRSAFQIDLARAQEAQ